MKNLETGAETVQKICDLLTKETLEPAKEKASHLLNQAKAQAEEIIAAAEKEKERLIQEGAQEVERQKHLFHSSLNQAVKQSVETLRQEIQDQLFQEELYRLVAKPLSEPDAIQTLIQGIVESVGKQGISFNLDAYIPEHASKEAINALLGKAVLEKLANGSVKLGNFAGGVEVKLVDKRMTVVITDVAIRELLASYIRKDLRKTLFGV